MLRVVVDLSPTFLDEVVVWLLESPPLLCALPPLASFACSCRTADDWARNAFSLSRSFAVVLLLLLPPPLSDDEDVSLGVWWCRRLLSGPPCC